MEKLEELNLHFYVLNDSRHQVPEKLQSQFLQADVTTLTDENYPSFKSKDELIKFADHLAKKIPSNGVVVLTGTIEIAMLVFTMLLRRDTSMRYAAFDFATKLYQIRHIDYLDLR